MKNAKAKNNFRVEIEAQYDTDLSQIRFDDEFERLDGKVFYISSYGENSEPTIDELYTIDKSNSKAQLVEYLNDVCYYDIVSSEWSKEQLRQEILDSVNDNELIEFYDWASKYLSITKNYNLIVTKGYSQGDYAEVVVLNGQEFEGIEEYIGNVFWDCPIWGRVYLYCKQGHDYEWDFHEFMDKEYDIDANDINERIEKFLKDRFCNVAALDNIMAAFNEGKLSGIKYPQ